MAMHPFRLTEFEADWNERRAGDCYAGLKWQDMPGSDDILRKINWFLFRRGLLADTDDIKNTSGNVRAARIRLRDARRAHGITTN